MKKTAKQRKDEAILNHVFNLQRIYPATADLGPVSLYKRLHRLEAEAHSAAERYCSYPTPEGYWEKKEASVLRRVKEILGAGPEILVNGDPRGYALKIQTEAAKYLDIHKDWGGFGIICPDF